VGNLEYSTDKVFTATSLEQVQESVKKNDKLKAPGSRYCFNNIADSKDAFISLKPMDNTTITIS
jgi:xylitol oxidase